MMRILHVIDTLSVGGAERVLVTLCNIFHQRNQNVEVLTILKPGQYADELLPGIKVSSLNRKWKFNLLKLFQLSKIASEFDIVHVHMRYDLRYVFLAKLMFGFNARIVSHDHFGDIQLDASVSKFSKYILNRVTYMAVSQDLIEWAVRKVGLPREKTFLLSNIVQIKGNSEKHNVIHGSILMVANIRPAKNLEFALEIIHAFKKAGKDYTLDIIGQINNKEYYQKILDLIDQYQLTKTVTLIHDCYDVQAIIPHYSIAIHTAKSESGPLVLIEYLGNFLPFLTFRTGRVVEQLQSELPEFICDSFELNEWVKSIEGIIEERKNGLRENLKIKMKTVFEKHYSEEKYFQDCLKIYEFAKENSAW